MPDVLNSRQLNRATLARQMLLERADMPLEAAVRFLGGLQAQQSNDPYIALWSRLAGFRIADLSALVVGRRLVRATSMRGTLHLHTADDLLGLRPLVAPFLKAMWTSNFKKRFGDADVKAVQRAGIRLLDKSPMTSGALGKALQAKFPSGEPQAKAVLLQVSETLIQVPPTRLWGNGSAPLLARAETWLPPPHKRPLSRIDLLRRYLAAFGPASISDMQVWSRLTKLSVEFEVLRDELVVFTDEAGRTLYDLPDAPRPDADTPAPPRFLPLYDNAYLGYDDRSRLLAAGDVKRLNILAEFKPALLVDGIVAAGWAVRRSKERATLSVEPYHRLAKAHRREIEAEGEAFIRFVADDAATFDVEILPVAA
ncbi:MAG: winged helix DNA-binding domain-containing protein [Devosia sp.]